jgi:hypothetical protein
MAYVASGTSTLSPFPPEGCQACCSGEPIGSDPLFQVSSVSL